MAQQDENLGDRMFATYQVHITGIKRTQAQVDKLDYLIQQIRGTQYTPGVSATAAANLGTKDVFRSKFDDVIGHVQEKTIKVMNTAMKGGKDIQAQVLRAAVTPTGRSGHSRVKAHKRNGPGRDDFGDMIRAIGANVEASKAPDSTNITGSHGWGLPDSNERGVASRRKYIKIQEKGGGYGIEAANSLGVAIPIVREKLKTELKGLSK